MSFSSSYAPSLESLSSLQPTIPSSENLQPRRSSAELYLSLVSYAFLVLIILFGNGLVVSAYIWNKWLQKAVTHTLIIGLSSADFLVGVVSLPIWMYISFCDYHGHKVNYHSYQFYITADIFIGGASILQLTGISIERCHAILRPFKHRQLHRRTFHIAVVAAWLFSTVLASLQPLQYGTDWQMPYTILTATVCFFIPVLVIITAYCSILVAAKTKASLSQHQQAHKASLEREIRLSLTVAMITLLFIMAWLPLFAMTMLATFDPGDLPEEPAFSRLLHFVKWMHYSSSALNPFLYSYRNPDLRRTIGVLLRRLILRRGPGVDEVFRRRTSSASTARLRKLSSASESSRKTSTGSQQSTSRGRSSTVLSWIRKQSSFDFEKKGKEDTVYEEGNNNNSI